MNFFELMHMAIDIVMLLVGCSLFICAVLLAAKILVWKIRK